MQTNLMTAGIITMLLALAPSATAYHSPENGAGGLNFPQQQGPGNGQITLCEDYTAAGLGQPGVGGMCFLSTDKDDLDGTAGAADEDWDIGGVAQTNDDVKDSNIWSCVREATDADGFYRVGSNEHGLNVENGAYFHYKELLAMWIDDGHVTFFAHANSGNAGLHGPYDAIFDCDPPAGSICNGPTATGGTGAYKMDTVCTTDIGPADPITETIEGVFGVVDCLLVAIDDFLASSDAVALADDVVACLT